MLALQKLQLQTLAQQQGFALFGVASAVFPPHADAYREWLDAGHAGEMEWMRRTYQRRTDLQLVLPEVRSLIMLGMSYWQGEELLPAKDDATGRIARYAWGDDYHTWLVERLRPLESLLTEWGGVQKSYTDTGPILERDFAALAGLGWQGKSTMLINRQMGNWFFLAEILTTLEFPVDSPAKEHCGSCTNCLDACPTGAILAPYQLDARRCLSYLTIENKGTIPEEFRSALGNRIYGCDECLEVCPWNRFAKISHETIFHARHGTDGWLLRDYFALDDAAFRLLFKNSPIKRIKRVRFLRNVAVALGNCGDLEDLSALEKAASSSESLLAEHANWAIQQIIKRRNAPL